MVYAIENLNSIYHKVEQCKTKKNSIKKLCYVIVRLVFTLIEVGLVMVEADRRYYNQQWEIRKKAMGDTIGEAIGEATIIIREPHQRERFKDGFMT